MVVPEIQFGVGPSGHAGCAKLRMFVRESPHARLDSRIAEAKSAKIKLGTSVAIGSHGGAYCMRSLTENEAVELLNSVKVGRLGCVDNGEPYVVPINYIIDEGSIYSHSLPGRKIEALRAHPRACLQVDSIEDDFNWRSAIAYGNFEEIRVPSDRRSVLGKLLVRFPLLTPVESVMAQDAAAPDSVVFRIRIDRITGMAEGSE